MWTLDKPKLQNIARSADISPWGNKDDIIARVTKNYPFFKDRFQNAIQEAFQRKWLEGHPSDFGYPILEGLYCYKYSSRTQRIAVIRKDTWDINHDELWRINEEGTEIIFVNANFRR